MSNMYGYNDYEGPKIPRKKRNVEASEASEATVQAPLAPEQNEDYDWEADDDPLRAGMWMEGDSLAPPCGSSIPLVHAILDFGSVDKDDVVYDFGCGDGRVLLEGLVRKKCKYCVGVEVEADLVARSHELIDRLPESYKTSEDATIPRIQIIQADLREVLKELANRVRNEESTETDSKTEDEGNRPYRNLPMPTIIILYLLPEAISTVEDDLLTLLRQSRIVCNTWGLQSIKPIEEKDIYDPAGASTNLSIYTKECFDRLKGFEYMLSVHNGTCP